MTILSARRIAGLQRLADRVDPELFVDKHGITWELTPTGWLPKQLGVAQSGRCTRFGSEVT